MLPAKDEIKGNNDYHRLLNLSIELVESGPWSGKGLENLWKVISLTDLLMQKSVQMNNDLLKIVSEWKKIPYNTGSRKPAVVNPLAKLISAARRVFLKFKSDSNLPAQKISEGDLIPLLFSKDNKMPDMQNPNWGKIDDLFRRRILASYEDKISVDDRSELTVMMKHRNEPIYLNTKIWNSFIDNMIEYLTNEKNAVLKTEAITFTTEVICIYMALIHKIRDAPPAKKSDFANVGDVMQSLENFIRLMVVLDDPTEEYRKCQNEPKNIWK